MPANDRFVYNLKTMHVVFAVTCVAIFIATIWMMAADHSDEWREYQKTGFALDAAMQTREKQQLQSEDFQQKKAQLEDQLQSAEDALESEPVASQLKTLREQEGEQALTVDLLTRRLKDENAERDKASADVGLAIDREFSKDQIDALQGIYDELQGMRNATEVELQEAQAVLDKTQASLKEITGGRDQLADELKKLNADIERIDKSLASIAPSSAGRRFKRTVMEWPILDGFNSHLKIQQDWLPDLSVKLGMTDIARFDRCRTCHMNVDKTLGTGADAFPFGATHSTDMNDWVAENHFPHPFATHPRTDLYTTSASPHPVADFGCTVCHDGQGSGTSFGNAEHSPNDPHQFEQWHEEYGFHPNHFWEYPMQPKRFVESTCIKCHHNVTELGVNPTYGASAPKVYKGFQLIQQYGCFGCHEIHGYDGGSPIGPDLRLEPQTAEEAAKIAGDPTQVAGKMRKVGPSLRHIASKTTTDFVQDWTEVPSRFRPSTRMPQFFNLTNQEDDEAQAFETVELAGIAQYLFDKSETLDLLQPVDGYQPDAERGKKLFSERGCLACHSHKDFPKSSADFGPDLSRVHEKIRRNEGDAAFSDWLYTWVREPERHHARTKMPNLYLDAYQEGETTVDPAADITAWLLSGNAGEFASGEVTDRMLDELVTRLLSKAISKQRVEDTLRSHKYPIPRASIKGDEIELSTADGEAVTDDAEWRRMKLSYIGRRTISRYGCYGCHDIPGFESARPIGTALQDWGRKDISKLAPEHIHEYLHHHGEPDGTSTHKRAERAIHAAEAGGFETGHFESKEEEDRELSAAYFYHSLINHGRPGFIWQKLRAPRSYDYKKLSTKGYDERLRMPKFPLNEAEIEAISTFVLGLVAEPPAAEYLYQPEGAAKDRIEGEGLLAKYNCTGCHMVELPKITYAEDLEALVSTDVSKEFPRALELLLKLKPPRQGLTGETAAVMFDGEETKLPVLSFHGLRDSYPDPLEDLDAQFHGFELWETLDVGDKRLFPNEKISFPATQLLDIAPARGGAFAKWLADHLAEDGTKHELTWQMSPPPLYQEGHKVQTPWLYEFLLEPYQLRHTTVLRMPRFNMSPAEARVLANYFAAVDGVPYPYQDLTPRDPDYLAAQTAATQDVLGEDEYLQASWKILNGPLCIGCHSVGGRRFKPSKADDIRGPNLQFAADRLRADWLELWMARPNWITPYTSMSVNFTEGTTQFTKLFGGDSKTQVTAIRDALINYHRLMESEGVTEYTPPKAAGTETGAE